MVVRHFYNEDESDNTDAVLAMNNVNVDSACK